MRKIILLFIFFYANISIYSQSNLDSLKNIWFNTSNSDSSRLKAIGNLAWFGYVFSDQDSAYYFAGIQYGFAKSIGNKKHMAEALNTQGTTFYLKSDYNEALDYFYKSVKIHEELGNKIGMSGCYTNIGVIHDILGDSKEALRFYKKALKIYKKVGHKKGLASIYINIGILYEDLENYDMALEYFFNGLNFFKVINNKQGIAKSYSNIGGVYVLQGKYELALEHHIYSLKINEGIENKNGIANSYINIGHVYSNQGNYIKALNYYRKSLKHSNEIGDKNKIASANINISRLYFKQRHYTHAIKYANKALQIAQEINALKLVSDASEMLYKTHKSTGHSKKALEMFETLISVRDTLAKEEGAEELMEMNLQKKYELKKQADSLRHSKELLLSQKDAIIKDEKLKSAYTFSKGLILISILIVSFLVFVINRFSYSNKQKRIIEKQQEVTLEKNRELERLSIVVRETENIILILDKNGNVEWVNDSFVKLNNLTLEELIAERGEHITTISNNSNVKQILETCRTTKTPYRYDSLNITNQGGRVWESSTITPIFDAQGVIENFIIIDTDITKQKDAEELVNQKNKDITDSINYAKRLQNAILPSLDVVNNTLPESFIYNNPKGIVSGDFYWLETIKKKIFFAVADCTGHGVPGALVSVVCSNVLTRSLIEENITQPAKILNRARDLVIKRFAKSTDDIRDGMDISLCSLDINLGELEWAGANNPLWIIRKNSNEIEEIISDKQPIGMYATKNLFTNHKIKIDKGDQFYLFSDGFSDQFGGKSSKKYKSSNFKKFLLSIKNHNMDKQHTLLSKEFDSWKGDLEQIDDVCVMGVKI